METYCGKNCAHCTDKTSNGCAGCMNGPGQRLYGDCAIAKCCREKGHQSCESCTMQGRCGSYASRDGMADYRRKKAMQEAADQRKRMKRVPYLGKWLFPLFWLFIPSAIAGVLNSNLFQSAGEGFHTAGVFLSILSHGCACVIMYCLENADDHYGKAWKYRLVWIGCEVFGLLILNASVGVGLFCSVTAIVFALLAEYNEFQAHARVLSGFDNDLSTSWEKLWKWYLILTCVQIGSLVLILVIPVISALALLASALGILVIGILELVYLYRTAALFRNIMNTLQ